MRDARGRFIKGADADRHNFTREERVRGGINGFQAMIESIVCRYENAIMRDGRHMVVNALPALILKKQGRSISR